MPKIAAVVLLFYPSEEVLSHIETYCHEVMHLYLVDNTEEHALSVFLKEKLLSFPNVSVIHQYENIGIAKAFNLALKHAKKDGYDWLLTMDQDSYFGKKEWSDYLAHFVSLRQYGKVGVIAPMHNRKFVEHSVETLYVKQEAVLSSGNLLHVEHALNAGAFDEALFIDEVDHAFCFELQRHGYDILRDQTVYLNHELGTPLGTHGNIRLYPAQRLYYMLRNYLYIQKKYTDDFPDFIQNRGRYLMKFFMKQLLFGNERILSIRMLWQGYMDHRHSIYGKYHGK
ncbi:hypothetical protein YH65_01495 [Sulfurovum lithotrophicum]|uniref:Glycosyltransferase 2-like domain-containing protein n=1 Tax=Sulfurovum lithotrophicum TaxID=206403 RepID=A0A7U4RQ02_9BACT|nr:glycosyltransferase [Sulfurovum lithotrophicum]AKF24217.1 hypothetical protein YH65_01495 [Sulfurovum lithotrophicum]